MKRNRIITALAAGGALWVAAGTATGADANMRADAQSARTFEMLDTNNDGLLSQREYRAGFTTDRRNSADDSFTKLDTNDDNSLSARELRKGWSSAKASIREDIYLRSDMANVRVAETAFKSADTDNDDFVSKEEFRAAVKASAEKPMTAFNNADGNNDQRVSRDEWSDHWRNLGPIVRSNLYIGEKATPQETAFEKMDADDDEALTLKEYREGYKDEAESSFKSLDADANGKITREEFGKNWDSVKTSIKPEVSGEDDTTVLGVERANIDASAARGPDGAKIFLDLDTDDDGQVTSSEFQVGVRVADRYDARRQFLRMDRNGDGYLEPAEFSSGWIHGKMKSGARDYD